MAFEERAFAVAESDTLGTKVLEWTETSQAWVYIDDNSQNAYGSGHYAGKVYAPSENEVYFTTAPGIVYRGTRARVAAPFTWESTRLPYEGPAYADRDPGRAWSAPLDTVKRYVPALGVTGTSADDVYAWFGNRIFRRTSEDGGPPTWTSEFVTRGEYELVRVDLQRNGGPGQAFGDKVCQTGLHRMKSEGPFTAMI